MFLTFLNASFLLFLRVSAWTCALILSLIFLFLLFESLPAFNELGIKRFLTDQTWSPLVGLYQMLPLILSSLTVALGAVLLSIPLAVAAAVFCHFYGQDILVAAYRKILYVLMGIPSVVYGFWGLMVVVPVFSHSLMSGVFVLALMIFPTMAVMMDNALTKVPPDVINGGRALGLGPFSLAFKLALPICKKGLFSAVLLSMGRAVGETMAVLMVSGNVVAMPFEITEPIRVMTANIALEMGYADPGHRAALFACGTLLFAVVAIFLSFAGIMTKKLK